MGIATGTRALSLASLPVAAILLASCSYHFTSGVQGTFSSTNRPILGYVSSGDERKFGEVSLGSVENMECQGEYRVSREGISILGLSIKDRVYKGDIFCLDGRVGSLEFISPTKGRTGAISGHIGGETFRANLIESIGEDCGNDYCRWGIKWTYERQREQRAILNKVRDQNKREGEFPTDGKSSS
jgi:hypothetical protein